jgi:hypothetical protein
MSEKKQINIDMGLFNVSGNKTRKKRPAAEKTNGIKIKQPSQKKKNDSLKKKSILKMIRQHQQERFNDLFDEKKKTPNSNEDKSSGFNKEFEEAQKFMQNLTEKTSIETFNKNKTLKQYPTTTNSLLYHPSIDPINSPISEVTNSVIETSIAPSNIILKPLMNNPIQAAPLYGCLKNGQLPTYRNYMNKTQKVFHNPVISGGTIEGEKQKEKTINDVRNEMIEKRLSESINRVNQMKQVEQKLQQLKPNYKPKKMKRKKTIRRTYKVGKSKMLPKVSVLVSNKTIRNNITTKSQLLKQTPIEEVKKHLIKYGLIKVGTIAPNDVLRKMYESSILMCGELYNHNPDYLLHNFVNGPK